MSPYFNFILSFQRFLYETLKTTYYCSLFLYKLLKTGNKMKIGDIFIIKNENRKHF